MDPIHRLLDELASHSIDRHGLIGSPGYTMPDVAALNLVPLDEIGRLPPFGVEVVGLATGGDNFLLLHPRSHLRQPLRLHLTPRTRGARVVVGEDCTLNGDIRLEGPDQTVILSGGVPSVGHRGYLYAELWLPGQLLFIGRASTSNGMSLFLGGRDKAILIGDDCMASRDVTLRTDDQHAVVALADSRWRNPPADVVLEPHVWLGDRATVGKGVVVGLGSIVGAQALVLESCERFSLLGGVPARTLARDVTWDRHAEPSSGLVERMTALAGEAAPFRLPQGLA
jgi:acetyltransferase-like isoleucine patch superfamily enzyme